MINKVQLILDSFLYPEVYSYWNQFREIQGKDQPEYVVYSQSDSPTSLYADNQPLVRDIGITVRYYYDTALESNKTGRTAIQARAKSILKAMENAGFVTTTGIMYMGDIDSVNKSTAVIDFTFSEVQ